MLDYYQREIRRLDESITFQHVLKSGGEKLVYGTYATSYKSFRNDAIYNGSDYSEESYVKSIINRVLELRRQMNETKNVRFHALASSLNDVEQKAYARLHLLEGRPQHTLKARVSQKQIDTFYELLTQEDFLICELKDWQSLFSPLIPVRLKEIVWKKSNRLLVYFWEELFDQKFILNSSYKKILEETRSIANNKGKLITANDLSAAKNSFQGGAPLPKGASRLNEIIKKVKNLNS